MTPRRDGIPKEFAGRGGRPGKRRRLKSVAAVLFLCGAAVFVYLRLAPVVRGSSAAAGPAVVTQAHDSFEAEAFRPVASSPPSFMDVAPRDMFDAFAARYRDRPDGRFLIAFETLTRHGARLYEDGGPAGLYRVGTVLANGREARISLLRNDNIVKEVALPLPTGFGQAMEALDAWAAAIESGAGGGGSKAPASSAPSGAGAQRFDEAVRLIDGVDPRTVVIGLSALEALWNEGYRTAGVLKEAARGYAMLLLVLTPDRMGLSDPFAAEALAFLTLARRMDPKLPTVREEALLAMTMGYRAHAAALLSSVPGTSRRHDERILDAYMRRDHARLRELRDQKPGVLGNYLLARLCREVGLGPEARAAALAFIQASPGIYPAVVENILSGELDFAKFLTAVYPVDIAGQLRSRIDPDATRHFRTWLERGKGLAGDEPPVSFARFEEMLSEWAAYRSESAFRFIVDPSRVRRIYKTLYTDAVWLRFELFLDRWNVADAAKSYVESLSAADLTHPLVLYMRGRIQVALGKRDLADGMFLELMERPGADGKLVFDAFKKIATDLNRIRALPLAGRALDGRPRDRLLLASLLQYTVSNGDLAARFYASGLAEDPHQYWAYRELARVRGSDRPLLDALERYPGSHQLLEAAGRHLAARSDLSSKERGASILGLAQSLAPSRSLLARKRADVLREMKRYDEAIGILTAWIDAHGRDGLAGSIVKADLAQVYLDMGQPRKALELLEADDVDAFQGGVMTALARAYEELGETDKATEQYRKAVNRYPGADRILAGAAGLLWRQGKYELAAEIVAHGRPRMPPFSHWYFDAFAGAFRDAAPDNVLAAVKTLQARGAPSREMSALAWNLKRRGNSETAFTILSGLKDPREGIASEHVVSAYRILRSWKGREAGSAYLQKAVPPGEKKALLMTVFYREGLFEEILDEMGDPESYPAEYREFMRLQRLVAWLARDKRPRELEARMVAHYGSRVKEWKAKGVGRITGRLSPGGPPQGAVGQLFTRLGNSLDDGHYNVGRYLLGMIPQGDLLDRIVLPKQRCEFAYYIGLSERLKGNFAAAAQWYHLCLETLLENNGEHHWASRELYWWGWLGLANRHRLLGDDLAVYEREHGRDRLATTGPGESL
jgi:tetratricopeptide (TPR) repeat protein